MPTTTIGAPLDVHRILGPGLLESVYEQALCVGLTLRRILFAHSYRLKEDKELTVARTKQRSKKQRS
jgi:GxxExxY protein